ncbi:hypothetical protein SAMN04488134_101256 [Amphibacillus marinus]|uniref:Tat pathway signal sequence domain protein n=1 Tax=Amphibacillus marinus TaxID=872970 RepID=A0A1H8H5G0_9BACI|nr:hypothetical protein [Amphibacillus marinus]SEN51259.1 hypothetical protein SAMN04488134_101256 [Amphibacillus marinus]
MKLKWLEKGPKVKAGVTFGVPWQQGKLKELCAFKLDDTPVQSWATAYWPDKSIKWTAHAVVVKQSSESTFTLTKQTNDQPTINHAGIVVTERENSVDINTGRLTYVLARSGSKLITAVKDGNGGIVAYDGQLIMQTKTAHEVEGACQVTYREHVSRIESVMVEKHGPIQATIKITGYCGHDTTYPFTMRLVFYNQVDRIKLLHTFFFNGVPEQHIVQGIGFSMKTHLTGPAYNRQLKLATESGTYNEPAQLLTSRRYRQSTIYQQQIAGKSIKRTDENCEILKQASGQAIWQDFKLSQLSQGYGRYQKRTGTNYAWVDIPTIHQSSGLLYVGGETGGLALSLKYFNEKYPSQFTITGLANEVTTATIWFWSPDGQAMDLRHYSETTHVESAYEGFAEMRASPTGIANTSEAYLSFFQEPVTDEQLFELANYCQQPSLLIAHSSYYYQTGATGIWPLKDTTTPQKQFLEQQLDKLVSFYQAEIVQRQWYGYWNYGDIMHSYDATRKQWFYDVGGYAWQNTELVPNLWLWYSFFRTGDSSIFRLIEAMTRHNSEVDRYHFGAYKGLGSRHNVSHWGCGCKEVRISMACLYKYYFYLTGDERIEELLDEVKDADQALDRLDPMREFYPKTDKLTHARVGPDWSALSSNWLSQWERKQDESYLNKIQVGINNLKQAPFRLLSGPTFKYDSTTSELIYMGTGNEGGYHMVIAFGAPQVWLELSDLLADEAFKQMLVEFGEVYAMDDNEKRAYSGDQLHQDLFHWPMFASGLIGYAGHYHQSNQLKEQAWNLLLNPEHSGVPLPITSLETVSWANLNEIPWLTTNVAAQWSLNVLINLYYNGDWLATDLGSGMENLPADR